MSMGVCVSSGVLFWEAAGDSEDLEDLLLCRRPCSRICTSRIPGAHISETTFRQYFSSLLHLSVGLKMMPKYLSDNEDWRQVLRSSRLTSVESIPTVLV